MADTLVSARVPAAKKEAAASMLKELGATTSELINTAFDYVIERKSLPRPQAARRPSMASYRRFLEGSTLAVDWGEGAPDGDYAQILAAGKAADYESLA